MDLNVASELTRVDLLRAALSGVFDPQSIIPANAADYETRLKTLAAIAVEQEHNDQWVWTLTPETRVVQLAAIPAPGAERQQMLDDLPKLLPGDHLGNALRIFLTDRADKSVLKLIENAQSALRWVPSKHKDDPNTLAQALKLLAEARVSVAHWVADPKIGHALRRAVVLDRRARAAKLLLPTAFRGRGREMRVLERYLQTGELRDTAANPVLQGIVQRSASTAVSAMAVIGIGGTGKSALMEALNQSVLSDKFVTFLKFDLDQTSLRAGERVAMTMELTRQIGLLNPNLDRRMSNIRRQLRERTSVRGATDPQVDQSATAVLSAMTDLGQVMSDAKLTTRNFALVFDTFEQALVAGDARVRLIADWLLLLRDVAKMTNLRVIFSGREAGLVAKIDTPELQILGHIELGDLGTNAGRAKLRDMFRQFEIPHLDVVPQLIRAYGSNPLVIEIVAHFCRDRSRSDIADLAAEDPDLVGELNAEKVQRFLYTRTLERIKDQELRPLASPGLILRHIAPMAIEHILAKPCGLDVPMPDGKAQNLYDRLSRHVWLVRETSDGTALEHIPDLRRVMLPQILSLPEASGVLDAASRWFAGQGQNNHSSTDFLESQYYAVLKDPDHLDGASQEEMLMLFDYLGASIEDFGPKAQAQLREASGALLKRDEIKTLSGDARSRAATKRSARQVADGLEGSVLAERDQYVTYESIDPENYALIDAMLPDTKRALFADANFRSLAFLNTGTIAPLFDYVVAPDSDVPDEDFNLAHPAWLTCLASLSPSAAESDREKLKKFVRDWWRAPENQSGIDRHIDAFASGYPGPADELVHLIIGVTDKLTWSELVGKLSKSEQYSPTTQGMVNEALDWRRSVLQYPFLPAEKLRDITDVPVDWSALPYFAPNTYDEFSLNAFDANGPLQVHLNRLGVLMKTTAPPLGDLQNFQSQFFSSNLVLHPNDMHTDMFRLLVPGLLPEFRAPLRFTMEQTRPSAKLATAIAKVTGELVWWPTEVAPEKFATNQHGPTLISTLIDLIDRASMLGELARSLAEMAGPHSKAAEIADLIDVFGQKMRS